MVSEVSIVGVVIALVEAAKRAGLPGRYAGLAAVVVAVALVMLWEVAMGEGAAGSVARWVLAGVIYGLAAAGLYSQGKLVPRMLSTDHAGSAGATAVDGHEPTDR